MNIKIEISAPELVAAIQALADSLTKQQAVCPESVKSEDIPVKEAELSMTQVELRAKVTEAIKANLVTNAEVRTLLDKHGKQKLTDLEPSEYTAFLELLLPS